MVSDVVNGIAGVIVFLGAAVWVGGYVTLSVITRVAKRTLSADQRVAFFRLLGRTFGTVATIAFGCVIVGGAVLLRDRRWDATLIAATVVAAAIVVSTAVGVRQARAMTRLRMVAVRSSGDAAAAAAVARGARSAAVLRSAIGVLTLALVGLGLALVAAG